MGVLLLLLGVLVLQQGEEPFPVGGNIARPKRVKVIQPEFPEEARLKGVQSVVIVELTLDRAGKVVGVKPLRGAPEVVPAALEAARQWEYEPALLDGKPVAVRFAETVLFVLRKPLDARTPSAGFYGGNGMFLRPPAPGADSASYQSWKVVGEAFTCCPCNTPCPCRSNAPPSHPPCNAATAQHFFAGHYGGVDLSGVTYVSVGPEDWAAIYFDEKMTLAQRQAILDLYASMAPGAQQVYLTARPVPLHYEVSPDRAFKKVTIPGILEMASRVKSDRLGRLLDKVFGMDVWANELVYGETGVYRYSDAEIGKSWDHSFRQSNHKEFTTTKEMYDRREMLIQHADFSGAWSPAQQIIITCHSSRR
jgi:TonB family protein